MSNERKFFKCATCGNIVGLIENGGGVLVCCGQEMELLVPCSADASQEKHVPVVKNQNGILVVEIGSVPHPMTEEHYIAWIAVAQGKTTQRKTLDKTGKPRAEFNVGDGSLTVYAYCNLHGLWKCETSDFEFNEMVCSAEFPDGCI